MFQALVQTLSACCALTCHSALSIFTVHLAKNAQDGIVTKTYSAVLPQVLFSFEVPARYIFVARIPSSTMKVLESGLLSLSCLTPFFPVAPTLLLILISVSSGNANIYISPDPDPDVPLLFLCWQFSCLSVLAMVCKYLHEVTYSTTMPGLIRPAAIHVKPQL